MKKLTSGMPKMPKSNDQPLCAYLIRYDAHIQSYPRSRYIFVYDIAFVPKGPINNIPALVQIKAWRRPGEKPFSEPMLVSSLTHICVTRPQWVKHGRWKCLLGAWRWMCSSCGGNIILNWTRWSAWGFFSTTYIVLILTLWMPPLFSWCTLLHLGIVCDSEILQSANNTK